MRKVDKLELGSSWGNVKGAYMEKMSRPAGAAHLPLFIMFVPTAR